jgi:glycosyltransferase involved in cell wall biosynthesis
VRIIFLIPTLASGGAERKFSELSLRLPCDIERTVVLFYNRISYPHGGDLKILDGEPSAEIQLKGLNLLRRIIRFRRIVQELRPDLVISIMHRADYVNLITRYLFLKKRYRSAIIVVVPFSRHEEMKGRLDRFYHGLLMSLLYPRSDRIVTCSQVLGGDLANQINVHPGRITVIIYNPVDIPQVRTLAGEEVEHPWFHDHIPIVVNVGRLSDQKDHGTLIRAFALLRKERPCRLVIVGDGPLLAPLQGLAHELGVAGDVLFTGFQPNPHKYVVRSALFALSSQYEGFPFCLLEAMAVGCPIVSTDCLSGPRELLAPDTLLDRETKEVEEGKFGLLVPVGRLETLAGAMRRLLDHPELGNRYTLRGRERIKDFDMPVILAKYLELIRGAVSKGHSADMAAPSVGG